MGPLSNEDKASSQARRAEQELEIDNFSLSLFLNADQSQIVILSDLGTLSKNDQELRAQLKSILHSNLGCATSHKITTRIETDSNHFQVLSHYSLKDQDLNHLIDCINDVVSASEAYQSLFNTEGTAGKTGGEVALKANKTMSFAGVSPSDSENEEFIYFSP